MFKIFKVGSNARIGDAVNKVKFCQLIRSFEKKLASKCGAEEIDLFGRCESLSLFVKEKRYHILQELF